MSRVVCSGRIHVLEDRYGMRIRRKDFVLPEQLTSAD